MMAVLLLLLSVIIVVLFVIMFPFFLVCSSLISLVSVHAMITFGELCRRIV